MRYFDKASRQVKLMVRKQIFKNRRLRFDLYRCLYGDDNDDDIVVFTGS